LGNLPHQTLMVGTVTVFELLITKFLCGQLSRKTP